LGAALKDTVEGRNTAVNALVRQNEKLLAELEEERARGRGRENANKNEELRKSLAQQKLERKRETARWERAGREWEDRCENVVKERNEMERVLKIEQVRVAEMKVEMEKVIQRHEEEVSILEFRAEERKSEKKSGDLHSIYEDSEGEEPQELVEDEENVTEEQPREAKLLTYARDLEKANGKLKCQRYLERLVGVAKTSNRRKICRWGERSEESSAAKEGMTGEE